MSHFYQPCQRGFNEKVMYDFSLELSHSFYITRVRYSSQSTKSLSTNYTRLRRIVSLCLIGSLFLMQLCPKISNKKRNRIQAGIYSCFSYLIHDIYVTITKYINIQIFQFYNFISLFDQQLSHQPYKHCIQLCIETKCNTWFLYWERHFCTK